MALKFDQEERPHVFPLTKDEFIYIKKNYDDLLNKVEQILSIDANTTFLYDFLNSIMPGFYERFYFRYCYLIITDIRTDVYDKKVLDDSLYYCKKFCEGVKSPEVYDKYMKTFPGIMYNFVTDNCYTFFDANLDELIIKFIKFVNEFDTFKSFKKDFAIFIKRISCGGDNYKDAYESLFDEKRLFPPRKIPRY